MFINYSNKLSSSTQIEIIILKVFIFKNLPRDITFKSSKFM